MPTIDDDSGSDREDEAPQVVVLKDGDLTADEVKDLSKEKKRGGGADKGMPQHLIKCSSQKLHHVCLPCTSMLYFIVRSVIW